MTATIFWQLLLGFGAISLVSVGGGIAVLPEMHRLVVDVHGWMSDADFARRFALPENADEQGIRAESRDGLIVIHIPKQRVVEPQPRQIQIQ